MAEPSGITESVPVSSVPAGAKTDLLNALPSPPVSNGEALAHKPYVPDEDHRPEFTWLPVVVGCTWC
jgi:hypothetical protein